MDGAEWHNGFGPSKSRSQDQLYTTKIWKINRKEGKDEDDDETREEHNETTGANQTSGEVIDSTNDWNKKLCIKYKPNYEDINGAEDTLENRSYYTSSDVKGDFKRSICVRSAAETRIWVCKLSIK